jgi:rhodanese-related sulfurtransferase
MALRGPRSDAIDQLGRPIQRHVQSFLVKIAARDAAVPKPMKIQTISTAELAALQRAQPRLVLLDVRLAEDFAAEHLRGAVNNCVFEVQFLERMKSAAPILEAPVCCYGTAGGSLESRVAAEKLLRAGYQMVYDLTSGLAGCAAGGLPTDRVGPVPMTPSPRDGVHAVDLAESWVEWTGRNLLNAHHGRIGLRRGDLSVRNGRLTGGAFVLEMAAITCHDLAGTPLHDVLIAHLRSDDFFDTARFPEATLSIKSASMPDESTPGSANLAITGDLTLKGITASLQFSACAGVTPDGKLAAQADFDIDRSRWHVLYGSGKFFQRVGGHLVNDLIGIRLRIVTSPASADR